MEDRYTEKERQLIRDIESNLKIIHLYKPYHQNKSLQDVLDAIYELGNLLDALHWSDILGRDLIADFVIDECQINLEILEEYFYEEDIDWEVYYNNL